MNNEDIVISTEDAARLNALLFRASHLPRTEAAVDALTSKLENAYVVDAAQVPRSVVVLGAKVDYLELPERRQRSIMLVHPTQADAGAGRISVFSPVGRALLGRRAGCELDIVLPAGGQRRIRIVGVSHRQGVLNA